MVRLPKRAPLDAVVYCKPTACNIKARKSHTFPSVKTGFTIQQWFDKDSFRHWSSIVSPCYSSVHAEVAANSAPHAKMQPWIGMNWCGNPMPTIGQQFITLYGILALTICLFEKISLEFHINQLEDRDSANQRKTHPNNSFPSIAHTLWCRRGILGTLRESHKAHGQGSDTEAQGHAPRSGSEQGSQACVRRKSLKKNTCLKNMSWYYDLTLFKA